MKITTWNVNGIRARLNTVLLWLRDISPDIVCLQETKSIDEAFPYEPFEDLGYNVATHGQKGFNGVAILSKRPFDEIIPRLRGNEDDKQARYLEAVISSDKSSIRVASIYLPNGNPIDSDKFSYKLAWMNRLYAHAQDLLAYEETILLCGDYNIIPEDKDVHDPNAWSDDALFQPESRQHFRALIALGYTDAVRACNDKSELYTSWDYQAGAWQKNHGVRIDHLLLSPQAADILIGTQIDARPRAWEKPSDHVPVTAILDI